MRVHRFMSECEYRKLITGETLENNSVHKGRRTNSVGFCFFTEPPRKAIHWLGGCVDSDYCVTMDIPDNMLTKTKAYYRDVEKRVLMTGEPARIERTEWCCRKYSIKDVRVRNVTSEYAKYSELKRELERMGLI